MSTSNLSFTGESSLRSFIDQADKAENAQELMELFAGYCQKIGVPAVVYIPSAIRFLKKEDIGKINEDGRLIANRYDRAFAELLNRYNHENLGYMDHVKFMAEKTGSAVRIYDEPKGVTPYSQFENFLADVRTAGFQDGICMPIFEQKNQTSSVIMLTHNAKLDLDKADVCRIRMFAYYLNERVRALMPDADEIVPLSEREREVLQWAGAGKSNVDIADIMMISEHTVNTYMRRSFHKLDVSTRIAAVVRALSLGLIDY